MIAGSVEVWERIWSHDDTTALAPGNPILFRGQDEPLSGGDRQALARGLQWFQSQVCALGKSEIVCPFMMWLWVRLFVHVVCICICIGFDSTRVGLRSSSLLLLYGILR